MRGWTRIKRPAGGRGASPRAIGAGIAAIVAGAIALAATALYSAIHNGNELSVGQGALDAEPTVLALLSLVAFILFLGCRLKRAVYELAKTEREATEQSLHDPLTGLANRAFFQQRLDRAQAEAREGGRFGLALVDLDDFKLVNDTLGHDSGDALLIRIAERLRSAVRSNDFIARLGGDEFAVIFAPVRSSKELQRLCERLIGRLNGPFDYQGKTIDCRVSVGASIAGEEGAEAILKEADLALYRCKGGGREAYRLYHPNMWKSIVERQQMVAVARESLAGGLVEPFYQPKVELRTGEIAGFEALLRLRLADGRVRGPDLIEAAFEDPVLAVEISGRIIDLVLDDVAAWRSAGLEFGHVAINAGAAELRSRDFASGLVRALRKRSVPAECVQLEVTESVLLGRGAEHVERQLRQLARAGIKLALDDFGTGFASLTHLKQFPIDVIKIDRRFVRDLQANPEDGAIVDAIVGLAAALEIEVVAEGIETAVQRDFLSALGCSLGQGYFFGSAMPAKQVRSLIAAAPRQALYAA